MFKRFRLVDFIELCSLVKTGQFNKLRFSESQTAPTPIERAPVCDKRKGSSVGGKRPKFDDFGAQWHP